MTIGMTLVRSISIAGLITIILWFGVAHPTLADTQAITWPQEIAANEGTIVIYQPQPERLSGKTLEGRAAMSIEPKGSGEMIFGAFWFTAQLDTDSDDNMVMVHDFKVTRVTWPDSKEAGKQRFTSVVEASLPKTGFLISRERLSASLATAEQEQKSLKNLKTDPPKIVFKETPAVLLLYDGEPRFTPLNDSEYERVLNTPFAVVRNKKTKACYLSSGQLWYEAKNPLGPWAAIKSPPSDLAKTMPAPNTDTPPPAEPPTIVVATVPTELIATAGKPKWISLSGGKLLYAENTETPWLREVSTGEMYVLLAGRWYRSRSNAGPWTFVRADKLPASFKEIPPGSDIAGLRTWVAGTQEAEEALLEAQIPQTAAIKRDEAKLDVRYDGEPKFEKITGTQVAYAVNTGAQVLKIDRRYYAVDNGVWFTSKSAKGPWAVADKVPEDEIQKIPPSSPVYNTTYVHVYHSTPQVVYVGYYPGYLWSFPYYGVPVYGTGWHYPPYYGRYYYPRPVTYGFSVGYNPWTGWSFGMTWSNGFFSFGVSWGGGYHGHYAPGRCCGGWYGGGYRGPVVINTGNINIGNNVNIGNRNKISNLIGKDKHIKPEKLARNNVYNRPENRARNTKVPAQPKFNKPRPSTRPNDIYVDRSGNIMRREGNQWQSREHGSWKPENLPGGGSASPSRPSKPAQRPSTPSQRPATTTQRPSYNRSDLNRAYQARQYGASRERSSGFSRGRNAPSGGGRMAR